MAAVSLPPFFCALGEKGGAVLCPDDALGEEGSAVLCPDDALKEEGSAVPWPNDVVKRCAGTGGVYDDRCRRTV